MGPPKVNKLKQNLYNRDNMPSQDSIAFKLLSIFKTIFKHPRSLLNTSVRIFQQEGLKALLLIIVDIFTLNKELAPQIDTAKTEFTNWIDAFDTIKDSDRAAIKTKIKTFPYQPLVSIILPVYNTQEPFLQLAIESVQKQLYSNWELCIADDGSTVRHIRPLLEAFQKLDSRVKVVFRQSNGHISEASNSALELATGEFIALLDHDDELAEHAIFMIVNELNQYRDADIIYSDEDKIDECGRRYDPFFKPDWSPDLFYSQNYVSHLGVYRTSIVKEIGGFRRGFEGSQDYDLCLRCVAKTQPVRIHHIPHILYHWRAVRGSTALNTSEKSYAEHAAISALIGHFKGADPAITVERGKGPTTYKINYPLPTLPPLVSLIIPTRDCYDILYKCVESIKNTTTYQNYELIIVDNQSSDAKTLEYLKQLNKEDNIQVLQYNKQFNYSAINNFAARKAHGDILGLINNDLEVITPEWLNEMVTHALRPEIGAVGAMLLYGNGSIQHAGVITGIGGVAGHSHKYAASGTAGHGARLTVVQNLSAVTAACLIVRKDVFEQVGGLNENNLPIAFNDVDFCLRVREAGYRNLWTPFAELYHHESLSRGTEDTPEKQARFLREIGYMQQSWRTMLLNDTYYNPNLTLDREDFSIAWPPRVTTPWRAVQ